MKEKIINQIEEKIEEIRDSLYRLYNLGVITQVQHDKLQDLVRSCGWGIGWEIDTKKPSNY